MISCAICGDILTAAVTDECIYSTPCGHVFHSHCLLKWIERSKTCPQCRNKTSQNNIIRIYFNHATPTDEDDCSLLKFRVDNLEFRLKMDEIEKNKLNEEKTKAIQQNEGLRKEVKTMRQNVVTSEQAVFVLKDEVKSLKTYCKKFSEVKLENEELKNKLTAFNSIKIIIEGSVDAAECVIENTDLEVEHLRHCVKQFKKTINNLEKEHKETVTSLVHYKRSNAAQEKKINELMENYYKLKRLQKSKENDDCNSTLNSPPSQQSSAASHEPSATFLKKNASETIVRPQIKRPYSSTITISPMKNIRLSKPGALHMSKSCSLIGVTARGLKSTSTLSSSGDDIFHPNKYVQEKRTKKIGNKLLSACATEGILQDSINFKNK